jgi:aldoxime dehydratase
MTMKLEPAIPQHLRTKRTQPLRTSEDFVPASTSYSSRFKPSVTTLPFVYFGIQYTDKNAEVETLADRLKQGFSKPNGPAHWDRATYIDEAGYTNKVIAAYWKDKEMFKAWQNGQAVNWWCEGIDMNGPIGLFREAYTPGVEDTETTFSHTHPEGYSHLADHWSEPTDTHDYWGSARDRMARSQTDPFEPAGQPSATLEPGKDSLGKHVRVTPHENLCLLRSGQDWTQTEGTERAFYLEKVEPTLRKGMMEIRNEGLSKGCYYNRYMTVTTEDGEPIEKTYSVSGWHSISEIEQWVQKATHLAIYNVGVKHYQRMDGKAKLRLYHEMFVIRAADQHYEYVNCHAQTGMLKATRRPNDDTRCVT